MPRAMLRKTGTSAAWVAAGAGLALMSGCGLPMPTDQDDAAARAAVDQLRKGDMATLMAHSSSEMKTPQAMATWPQVRALFPQSEPLSVKRVGWNSNANVGQPPMLTLSEAYDFPDRVVTASVSMSQMGGPHQWIIRGLYVNFTMKPGAAPPPPASAAPPSSAKPA